jgi:hypothetical protein
MIKILIPELLYFDRDSENEDDAESACREAEIEASAEYQIEQEIEARKENEK